MTTMNISLTEKMREYIENRVSQAGYGTASEYIRELVRGDQKQQIENNLESLLLEGLSSGPLTPFTNKDIKHVKQILMQKIKKRIVKE